MSIDEFWAIVDRVHAASPGDMKIKCTVLDQELRKLAPEEVRSFGENFTDCFYRAYNHEVWGAAFVIGDGCGDDSFMDFRSTLISLGRVAFETALTDADSLVKFDIDPKWAKYEGYQYVPALVYRDIIGKEPECDCPECQPENSSKKKTHPREPTGKAFSEWELSSRFPKLAAKYGFKDSDWINLKHRKEKEEIKLHVCQKTADILLRSGIIPGCGLVPIYKIVKELLKSGQSPLSTGTGLTWEPYDLDEGHYWGTITLLEKMLPCEKTSRPELGDVKLRLDLSCVGAKDFDDWMQRLKQRGLA